MKNILNKIKDYYFFLKFMKRFKYSNKITISRSEFFYPSKISSILIWKDKFDSPRVAVSPYLKLSLLWFEFDFRFGCEDFWERWLWFSKYSDYSFQKSEKTWVWRNTDHNTWYDIAK